MDKEYRCHDMHKLLTGVNIGKILTTGYLVTKNFADPEEEKMLKSLYSKFTDIGAELETYIDRLSADARLYERGQRCGVIKE